MRRKERTTRAAERSANSFILPTKIEVNARSYDLHAYSRSPSSLNAQPLDGSEGYDTVKDDLAQTQR